jgi:hypothetical protein
MEARENEKTFPNDYGVLLWDDGNILELDTIHGWTTL